MVAHRVCQSPNGVIEDEKVLVLVFTESKNQRVQNISKVRHQLSASLLFQGSKGTVGRKVRVRDLELKAKS